MMRAWIGPWCGWQSLWLGCAETMGVIRAGRDEDAASFIDLIAGCWAEYPGCVMDVDGENPELRALANHFETRGGALWVAEQAGRVVGMVATKPEEGATWELCRMYVAASARGTGLADALVRRVETHARDGGAERLILWSDTRFDRAHRFYERQGFVRQGGIRPLFDLSNSIEVGYAKPLVGLVVERLDTASCSAAIRGLAAILQDCVADGASVSFLPPLARDAAESFYRRAVTDIAAGRRVLLAAWLDGALVGSVMLDLAMPQNQTHRADVQKMLVSPKARRRGVARAMLAAIEAEALAAGRSLLVLDTRKGDPSEALYAGAGWLRCGEIPLFCRDADGGLSATVLFYKSIAEDGSANP